MSALSDEQAARVFYTWTAQASAVPLEIVGGEGARFTTADGARWWDLGSMTWNAALGHGHPRMKRALGEAAARGLLVYPTAVFPAKARAGELLAEVTPRGPREDLLLSVGRRGQRERRQDGAPLHRAEEDRGPHAQLPRRHAGDALALR